jgi:hypothetical protein
MKEPKLSKESARAFVARFAANVKQRMEAQDVSLADIGRVLSPEANNPTSRVYQMLRAAKLPSDEVMAQVAKALNCTVEALHHGELEQYKGGQLASAAHRKVRASRKTSRGQSPGAAQGTAEGQSPVLLAERALAPAEANELYGFVLDAVCACAAHLAEPRKGQYIRELARTCRKYQAAEG